MANSEPTATQLKNEGNALYTRHDYVGAFAKYTKAIAVDGENAVLYANRSACNLEMKKYLDAAGDAHKAVELDPTYAKGWSRLAAAEEGLHEWGACLVTWQKALDCLPKAKLTPAELRQKEQYTARLQAIKDRIKSEYERSHHGLVFNKNGIFPWQAAKEMMPELEAAWQERMSSSAWVIHGAYEEFKRGVDLMKSLKKVSVPGFPMRYHGNTEALTLISNGIMRDMRVFHIDDPNWIEMYNDQIVFETTKSEGWPMQSLETVIEEARQRQREKGWGNVRPALSTTVRAWIMRAVFDDNLRGEPQIAEEFLKRSLDLLEWGRQFWKNVPSSDRGAIFEDTFIRGVRSMHLETFMRAYLKDPGLDSKFPLELLLEEARDHLKETRATPLQGKPGHEYDPGFVSSFYLYPAGVALTMIGFYHSQMAKYSPTLDGRREHSLKAAKSYLEAAHAYPEDDEQTSWYLRCAIQNLTISGSPLKLVLDTAHRIRVAMPMMQRIWQNSALAKQGRDEALKHTLELADDWKKQVETGKISLDSMIREE